MVPLPSITRDDAEAIVYEYKQLPVRIIALRRHGESSDSRGVYTITYEVDRTNSQTLFLELGTREVLDAEEATLRTVRPCVPALVSSVLKLDHSKSHIPHSYALLSCPPGSPLDSIRPPLPPLGAARIDLFLGDSLKRVHNVQNDWFGLPGAPADWKECYSWQECFMLLLDTALCDAERVGLAVSFEDLRRMLARAIGSYLFDDVEVPCLIWNTALGWEESVFVQPESDDGAQAEVTGLCNWAGAIWGDPLMDGALREPSTAFIEGYGGSPIVFARQNTKRLWYTTYVALKVLVNFADSSAESPRSTSSSWSEERVRELLRSTVEELKNAPCY